ncbi:hypothetical protein WJX81_006873 [Elliptochloris bilobata]|uniref:SNARE-complex protein Syntaxin-18 N-terminal domain-containing protein n=1 Tax=Elliptochloris bilobata TaxID=381761 RepID=A0AAW1RTN8_9CHLO
MDRTPEFWRCVISRAQSTGVPEARMNKLRSAQILRSLATKTAYTNAATEVAKNVDALAAFVGQHRRDYVQPGRCSEAERDRIEEQVGAFVRTCTDNIARLEASVAAEPALNSHVVAHRHGAALILSERLHAVGSAFDRCRSLRYQQLLQQQRRRRALPEALAPPRQPYSPYDANSGSGGAGWQDGSAEAGMRPEQRQVLEAENAALAEQLANVGHGAALAESTMRELATLHQMLSTQVMHQSEQIEQLYTQAVAATLNVERGNVHLTKAIAINSSARC